MASVRLLCEIRILGLGYQTLSKPCAINDFCPGPGSHFENMIIFCPWSGSVPENPNFLPWPGPVFENLSFRLPWPGSVFENLSHYCHYKVYVRNSSFCFVLPRPASVFENLSFFGLGKAKFKFFCLPWPGFVFENFDLFPLARFPTTEKNNSHSYEYELFHFHK